MSKQSVKQKKGKSSKAADIEKRNEMIALEAYLRAEQRGFEGGDPIDDWLVAEAEIDSSLK